MNAAPSQRREVPILKLIAIALVAGLVFASPIARPVHANGCIKVDDDNSPTVTVKGRTIPAPKLKVSTDRRAAKGPHIRLKEPLHIDTGSGCETWREIPVHGDHIELNRPVTITGSLGRFGSALVKPPIFIEAETLK